jgi:hypothetical protein
MLDLEGGPRPKYSGRLVLEGKDERLIKDQLEGN